MDSLRLFGVVASIAATGEKSMISVQDAFEERDVPEVQSSTMAASGKSVGKLIAEIFSASLPKFVIVTVRGLSALVVPSLAGAKHYCPRRHFSVIRQA
jgi:hypothetical protein